MSAQRDRQDKKRGAFERGRRAEWIAALWLLVKGYRIAERNFRCRLGEIDIVARKRDLIVFVEVKARPQIGEAIDAVSHKARQRIANAANLWIGKQPDAARLSWRFDVVAVMPMRLPRHFPDAF